MSLTGKRVLVTGGTGHLGRALARRLVDAGAWVAVTYRSNEELERLFASFDRDEPQPEAFSCELSDPDSVEALAERLAQSENLPLDGIACLAGGFSGGKPLWEADADELNDMIAGNLLPTWLVLRRFLGGMVDARFGRIVTVGAREAVTGTKGAAAYSAAKGAVVSLTRALAEDVRGSGVTVTCVLPRKMRELPEPDAATPGNVADAVMWLLDDDAEVTNGAILPVYGS